MFGLIISWSLINAFIEGNRKRRDTEHVLYAGGVGPSHLYKTPGYGRNGQQYYLNKMVRELFILEKKNSFSGRTNKRVGGFICMNH